jgi:hypothetical protein
MSFSAARLFLLLWTSTSSHLGFVHIGLLTSKPMNVTTPMRRVLRGNIGERRRADEIDIDRMI